MKKYIIIGLIVLNIGLVTSLFLFKKDCNCSDMVNKNLAKYECTKTEDILDENENVKDKITYKAVLFYEQDGTLKQYNYGYLKKYSSANEVKNAEKDIKDSKLMYNKEDELTLFIYSDGLSEEDGDGNVVHYDDTWYKDTLDDLIDDDYACNKVK